MTRDDAKLCITAAYESATLDEFCQKTGLDRRAASNRLAHLRRHRVKLPKLPTSRKGRPQGACLDAEDWAALQTWAGICAGAAAMRRLRAKAG